MRRREAPSESCRSLPHHWWGQSHPTSVNLQNVFITNLYLRRELGDGRSSGSREGVDIEVKRGEGGRRSSGREGGELEVEVEEVAEVEEEEEEVEVVKIEE